MRKQPGHQKSFSLIEMIVVIGIFGFIIFSLGLGIQSAYKSSSTSEESVRTSRYIEEVIDAILLNKEDLWHSIIVNTDDGPKHLVLQNDMYEISDGYGYSDDGEIKISFTIDNVERLSGGQITGSGGELDINSRSATVTAEWTDSFGGERSLSQTIYINNWSTPLEAETTKADFEDGSLIDSVIITDENGGEIRLDTQVYPDWCYKSLEYTYDLAGDATSKLVYARETNRVGLSKGMGGTGNAFTKLGITYENIKPTVSQEIVYGTNTVYDISLQGKFFYMNSSVLSNEELDVFYIGGGTPTNPVATYNLISEVNQPRTTEVNGSWAYMAMLNKMYIINLASIIAKESDPSYQGTWIGALPLAGTAPTIANNAVTGQPTPRTNKIIVRGNYAYIILNNDRFEFAVVNVTNRAVPGSPVYTDLDINAQNQDYLNTNDIYVTEDGNITFVAVTDFNNANHNSLKILNTTNKTSSAVLLGSFDPGNLLINGLAVIESDNAAVFVGQAPHGLPASEYQVLDISGLKENPITIPNSTCYSFEFDEGISDITALKSEDGLNSFAYMTTNKPNEDFMIIRGGPVDTGGGGGNVAPEGQYVSGVINSGQDNTRFLTIGWNTVIPALTTVKIQVRTGFNLATDFGQDDPWYGPNGLNSFYVTDPGNYIPEEIALGKYIQYKIDLASEDEEITPIVEDVNFTFERVYVTPTQAPMEQGPATIQTSTPTPNPTKKEKTPSEIQQNENEQ